MEKKTSDLSFEVLKRLEKAKILKSLVLIGSWSIYFYKYYFKSNTYSTYIRTQDIDFLIPIQVKLNKNVDIFALVKDFRFIMDFRGSKGYIKLAHPDLTIEFLIPEIGKGSDKPYPIP